MLGAFDVAGPEIAPETVVRIVCERDCVLEAAGTNDGGRRAEGFFRKHRHRVVDVGDDRGVVVEAVARRPRAAQAEFRAARDRIVDLLCKRVAKIAARDRAERRFAVERVAENQLLRAGDERFRKGLVNRRLDDEALGRDAALPVILKTCADGHLRGGLDVGVAEHDERIGAAKLQHRLLKVLARNGRNGAPGAFASGQCHRGDAGVGDNLFHVAARDDQRREDTRREAGLDEEFLDRKRAAGNVARVLEHDDITGSERRRGRTKELPIREIPWHDREQHAERTEPDVTLGRICRDDLVGEVRGPVLRVVVASERALLDLRLRLDDRLAHFAGRKPCEFSLALAKRSRQGAQRIRTLVVRGRTPAAKPLARAREPRIDLGPVVFGVGFERSAGRRIDGRDLVG